jgi:hypothetical protein
MAEPATRIEHDLPTLGLDSTAIAFLVGIPWLVLVTR